MSCEKDIRSLLELQKIHNKNCVELMATMPDNSIDLIVTSPPYFVDKEYENYEDYSDYQETMMVVFVQMSRILKGGAYAVINFGDYFNSGDRFYEADVPSCYPASMNYFKWGVKIANMDLQATRIWRKQFAKMGIPFVCNSHPRPIFDYEHVWTFRKKNGRKEEFVNDRKLSQRGVIGENWKSSAKTNMHCEAFPVELPKWAIDVYSSSENDVVFDPFMWSGTTILACLSRGRPYIGCEIRKDYFELAESRIADYVKARSLVSVGSGYLQFGN